MKRLIVPVIALSVLAGAARGAGPDGKQLAAQVRGVLKQYCQRCHHGDGSEGGDFDVLIDKSLTTARGDDKPYVVAGKPNDSFLYQRLVKDQMPPKKIRERPSDADKDVIKRWIEAGAPPYPTDEAQARAYVSQGAVLSAIRDHLRQAIKEDRPYLRYFTLANLHNNPKVPDADLRGFRAALSKALNSLSWKPDVLIPKAIDKDQTVFAIDIRDLDWDRDHLWRAVMRHYPYGLRYATHPDPALQQLDTDVSDLSDCELPYVRADWFVATATRPPLYHVLLQLPNNAKLLERRLKVDVEANFLRDRLTRGAFAGSGVSGQNRLVERHVADYGAYWKSYDFKEGNRRSVLTQLPLGPPFAHNQYDKVAFVHDGGEIIFNLPNGLQGYLLVNGKDGRIDEGPVDVVNDPLKTSGTPAIVSGLSCMACHKHGMIGFKDQIRDGAAVLGEARRKVQRLYPPQSGMDAKLKEDEQRFLTTLEKSVGPFLRVGEDKDKPLKEFSEPVGEAARLYRLVDLDLSAVAYELDIDKPAVLQGMIAGNKKLRELGLAPLLKEGGAVKRNDWEAVGATSLMQRAARELERGSPFRLIK
jgi:mono/diheme cytochrome c family protein